MTQRAAKLRGAWSFYRVSLAVIAATCIAGGARAGRDVRITYNSEEDGTAATRNFDLLVVACDPMFVADVFDGRTPLEGRVESALERYVPGTSPSIPPVCVYCTGTRHPRRNQIFEGVRIPARCRATSFHEHFAGYLNGDQLENKNRRGASGAGRKKGRDGCGLPSNRNAALRGAVGLVNVAAVEVLNVGPGSACRSKRFGVRGSYEV